MTAPERLMAICQVMMKNRINGTQLQVLALIPNKSAKEIAELTEMKAANIHAAIRSLLKREIITKVKNPENKRFRVLQVTEGKGKALMFEIAKALA
jgi:DNA-binding MarR family transcriptional regulator